MRGEMARLKETTDETHRVSRSSGNANDNRTRDLELTRFEATVERTEGKENSRDMSRFERPSNGPHERSVYTATWRHARQRQSRTHICT